MKHSLYGNNNKNNYYLWKFYNMFNPILFPNLRLSNKMEKPIQFNLYHSNLFNKDYDFFNTHYVSLYGIPHNIH